MKHLLLHLNSVLLSIALALALTACDSDLTAFDPETALLPSKRGLSMSVVYRLDTTPEVIDEAYSELSRNESDATVRFSTRGLEPAWIYSLWAIVYADPEACTGGRVGDARCGTTDKRTASHLCGYATATEHAAFVCRTGSAAPPLHPEDIEGAEVHIVLRAHGPMPPGAIDQALGSTDTDCWSDRCVDAQMAVHAPL